MNDFLNYYQENGSEIHYVDTAEHLGIGRITAYEMLRLLEKYGLVESKFYLPKNKSGPGRAIVLFSPSPKGKSLIKELGEDTGQNESWEILKEQILNRIQQGKLEGFETLLGDLLSRIPDRKNSLTYLTEMTATLVLTLRTHLEGSHGKELEKYLQKIGLPGELGVNVLASMGMAFGLVEQANLRLGASLLKESIKYQQIFSEMNKETQKKLGTFAREVIKALQE